MGPNRRTQDRERAARAVVRRTERVPVILPADELAAIEEFRFQASNAKPIGCGSGTSKTRDGSCVSCRPCSRTARYARLEMLMAERP